MYNPSIDTSARVAEKNEVCSVSASRIAEHFGLMFRNLPKITWSKIALAEGECIQGMTLPGIEGLVGLELV